MNAFDEIHAFGVIPWEPLAPWQIVLLYPLIRYSYGGSASVKRVPKPVSKAMVPALVLGGSFNDDWGVEF